MLPKLFYSIMAFICLVQTGKAQLSFTVNNVSGTNTITCTNDTLNLLASSNATGNINYNWTSLTVTLTGANVKITKPGNYTVTATSGTLTSLQLFSIGINTTIPVSTSASSFFVSGTVAPTTMTFIVTSPTINITQSVYSPGGGTLTSSSPTMIFLPSAAGVYWHCVMNDENGCATCFGPGNYGPGSPATTGISKNTSSDILSIFPNPGNGYYRSNTNPSAYQMEIYNDLGRLIISETIENGPVNINIYDQPSGIYLVKLLQHNGVTHYCRLIKE